MKSKIIFISLLLFSLLAGLIGQHLSESNKLVNLEIVVSDLKNNKGKVIGYLFSDTVRASVEGYPRQKYCTQKVSNSIIDNTVVLSFNNLPDGIYAFYLHHDENNDGQMNTNIIGMPTEGYSFSNNAKPGMTGLPNFAKAKITLTNTLLKINTTLIY